MDRIVNGASVGFILGIVAVYTYPFLVGRLTVRHDKVNLVLAMQLVAILVSSLIGGVCGMIVHLLHRWLRKRE